METKELAGKMIDGVKAFVERSLQPILRRIGELEARQLERGEKGEIGERGEKGERGEPGDIGPKGDTGEVGPKGDAGERGERGEPGEVGQKGDIGERGEKGEPGDKGDKGDKGETGDSGPKGDIGERGEKGDRGEQGEKGLDGEDGRDALQIEVLDSIDPIRRYQRGVYATYRGGLVRSRRQTDFLPEDGDLEKCGWQVVVRGVDDVAVEFSEDLRTFALGVRYTDGSVYTKEVSQPVIIYRGVWAEDHEYRAGDAATRDGSTWVLMSALQKGRPGEPDSGWQLSTKRGRDGRDGLRGEKGEAGVKGRDGKDFSEGPRF